MNFYQLYFILELKYSDIACIFTHTAIYFLILNGFYSTY